MVKNTAYLFNLYWNWACEIILALHSMVLVFKMRDYQMDYGSMSRAVEYSCKGLITFRADYDIL